MELDSNLGSLAPNQELIHEALPPLVRESDWREVFEGIVCILVGLKH